VFEVRKSCFEFFVEPLSPDLLQRPWLTSKATPPLSLCFTCQMKIKKGIFKPQMSHYLLTIHDLLKLFNKSLKFEPTVNDFLIISFVFRTSEI